MRIRYLPIFILVAFGLFVLLPALARAEDEVTTTFDRWYVLEMAGDHAGYMHVAERQKADQIITQNDVNISMRRAEQVITITLESWFTETVDGRPMEAASAVNAGAAMITQHVVFKDEGLELTTGQGPNAQTATLPPLDSSCMPPAAAQRYIDQQLTQGVHEMSVDVIDVSMGVNPVHMSVKVIGKEDVEVIGKVVPAVVWEANLSNMPGIKAREYVDEHGRTIKSSVQLMPGMDMIMIEADEQLAKADIKPPAIMAQTLIYPDKPIPNARNTRHAIYRITIKDADGTLVDLPRTGYQRVVWDDQTNAAVVLDLNQPVNVIDDLPTDDDLASSNMIDHTNQAVRDQLTMALRDMDQDASDSKVASRLRAFVHEYIDAKDLSVGLARASEVARTAQGDCTEHAVLLAALLRAKGIPARTVSGLLYVDEFLGQSGVFDYHMWTQAWVVGPDGSTKAGQVSGGRWVDLDAVLPDLDFDAAHIALIVSSMADDQMVNDMIDLLPTLGRLEVQVVEAE